MLNGIFYGHLHHPTWAQLGSAQYWLDSANFYSEKWSQPQRDRLHELQHQGARIAYWRSNEYGRACNGGTNDPVSVGLIERAYPGTVLLCSKTALHATLKPPRWNGSRLWVVALLGEVTGDDEKFGAAIREILGEAQDHPWDLGAVS